MVCGRKFDVGERGRLNETGIQCSATFIITNIRATTFLKLPSAAKSIGTGA